MPPSYSLLPRYVDELKQHRAIMDRWQKETDDTAPDHLTGKPIPIGRVRGVMPGTEKQAMQTVN